ncbi:unnamed protein product [Scytosiphon promiscuus]
MAVQRYEHIDDETKPDVIIGQSLRRALALGYISASGCCGMVLMALNSTLVQLAVNCGTTSVEVGTVFIAMAAGTGVGVLVSPMLYRSFHGNLVISSCLLALTGGLLSMPFVSSVFLLHLAYFVWGTLHDTIITGCQIMTQKVHGSGSGVWMGANMVALGLSSALVTVIFYLEDVLFRRYAYLSAWCFLVAFFLGIVLPAPEKSGGSLDEGAVPLVKRPNGSAAAGKLAGQTSWMGRCPAFIKTYSVELQMFVMLVMLVGGQTAATAYLQTFVERTDAIADSQETLLMVDMWVAAAIGLVGGLWDQQRCTVPRLYRHATVAFLSGGAAGASILAFQDSAPAVWVCIALMGLSYGPTVGYCYELYNRISVSSETGMAIVTFGVSFGSPAVPYAMSLVLDHTTSSTWFLVILVLTRLLPYPLLLSARRNAEEKQRRVGDSVHSGGARFSATRPHDDETARLLP